MNNKTMLHIEVDVNDIIDSIVDNYSEDDIYEIIKKIEIQCASGDLCDILAAYFMKESIENSYDKESKLKGLIDEAMGNGKN